jgi:hypothetical protein
MPLQMDDAYVQAKTQLLKESYDMVKTQLVHAFGQKKAETMIRDLFPKATAVGASPRLEAHVRASSRKRG